MELSTEGGITMDFINILRKLQTLFEKEQFFTDVYSIMFFTRLTSWE